MTNRDRLRRIQRWVGVKDDGVYGRKTIDKLEKVLGITEWQRTKLPPVQPAPPSPGSEFDARTEKHLATLLPAAEVKMRLLVRSALQLAERHGCTVKAISGTRTWAEQDALYAQGRTRPGKIVTRARGGYSNHNFGIAIDLGVFRGKKYLDGSRSRADRELAMALYRELSRRAKALGIAWGGDWRSFKDPPHFEYDTGLTLAQMRARVRNGQSVTA